MLDFESQLRSLAREERVGAHAWHCRPLEGQLLSAVEIVRPETTAPSVCMLSSVFAFNRCVNNDLVEKRAGHQWTGHFPQRRDAQVPRVLWSERRWPKRSTKRMEGPALLTKGITMSEEGSVWGSMFNFCLPPESASPEGVETPACAFTPSTGGRCACFYWLCEKELVREGAKTVDEMLKGKMSTAIFGSRLKELQGKNKLPSNGSLLTAGKQF